MQKLRERVAAAKAFLHSSEFAKRVECAFLASNTVIAALVLLASYVFIFGPGAHPNTETFLLFMGFSAACFVAMDAISGYANEPKKFNIRSLRLSMLALIISLLIVRSVGVPQVFVFAMISLLIMAPLVYVVRTKWKISGHLYAFTAVTTILSMVSSWFTPLYLLIPLISWSRLKLRVHTAGQVVAGAVIGFVVPVTIALVMNLAPAVA